MNADRTTPEQATDARVDEATRRSVEAVADGALSIDGDPAVMGRLAALLDPPDDNLAIVTP